MTYERITLAADARMLFVHVNSVIARIIVEPMSVIHTYTPIATIVVRVVNVARSTAITELYMAWEAAENIDTISGV